MVRSGRPTGWGGPPVEAPDLASIREAARRGEGLVRRTPVLPLRSCDEVRLWSQATLPQPNSAGLLATDSLRSLGGESGILLKAETLQDVTSFKIRGVASWIAGLTDEERGRGLSTHSAGNTAQALGHVARVWGCQARTLLPDTTPEVKVRAIEAYGVTPIKMPFPALMDFIFSAGWTREPWSYLNPWSDPAMIAGNASLGLEILDQVPEVESLFVPVGGGGLAAGIGAAIRARGSRVRLVGVQAAACPALPAALEAGRGVWVDMEPSLSDISLPVIVDEIFDILREVVEEWVMVDEAELAAAVRRLAVENKLVVEGAGALALAGALKVPRERRGVSVCLLTGGSLDPGKLARILEGAP